MNAIRFGTDGWRAIIAEDFTFANVRLVANAVAATVHNRSRSPRLVVGYDTRFASDRFALAVAEVLTAAGVRVLLADRPVPTPVLSYAIVDTGADGGIMITASHNPAAWNGIKIKTRDGGAAGSDEVAIIERQLAIQAAERQAPPRQSIEAAVQAGQLERLNLLPRYIARLHELVDLPALRQSGLTIVADSLYGSGGGLLAELLSGATTVVEELHGQPNPLFPGLHGPEPVATNLVALGERVRLSGADVGLALDGDADRIGLVDELGRYVNQQRVFTLLTLYLLEIQGRRGPIVKSVNATTLLDRLAAAWELPVTVTPVGFKYLGPTLQATAGLIAGEESGGFAFQGHIPERDGLLAGLYLLDYQRRLRLPMSGLIARLHERLGPAEYDRLDLTFAAAERESLTERVQSAAPLRLADRAVEAIDRLDGTKFQLAGGSWLLIRFSGTEPLLRLYAEGETTAEVAQLLAAGRAIVGLG